jgi:hypothetical protein
MILLGGLKLQAFIKTGKLLIIFFELLINNFFFIIVNNLSLIISYVSI